MSVKLIAVTKPVDETGMREVEQLIAYMARVSNPDNQDNHATAERLLKYLAKNRHWSPFEMCNMVLEIKTTRDISRQILRHRSFHFQEFSGRYAQMPSEVIYREARLQDHDNRQNSLPNDDSYTDLWWHDAQIEVRTATRQAYEMALHKGIAKEQARALLPEGLTPTRMYMNGTIRSWMHYTILRRGPETQKEHRLIALQCQDILIEQFPSLETLIKEMD